MLYTTVSGGQPYQSIDSTDVKEDLLSTIRQWRDTTSEYGASSRRARGIGKKRNQKKELRGGAGNKRFATFSSAWAQVTKRVSLTRSVAATPYLFSNLNALER
jgi:hypothetical protein